LGANPLKTIFFATIWLDLAGFGWIWLDFLSGALSAFRPFQLSFQYFKEQALACPATAVSFQPFTYLTIL
jgi:hypothetical protein